jgi:hypothetical protein
VAKSYIEAQKFIGGEKIAMPQEGWQQGEYDTFYNALGRPEAPDGYDLSDFTPPEGVPWDNDFLNTMVEKFHGAGLSQQQVANVLKEYGEAEGARWQAAQQQIEVSRQESEAALRNEFGTAFAAKIDAGTRAIKMAAGETAAGLLELTLEDGTKLGNHPDFIRAWANVGDRMSEHGIEGPKNLRLSSTPAEAMAEQNKLLADEGFRTAYLDKHHPEHAMAVAKIQALTTAEVGEGLEPEVF